MYQFRYVEENARSKDSPWSIRHMGMYHRHSVDGKNDVFILLNPYENSAVEKQLLVLVTGHSKIQSTLKSLCEDPFRLHLLPFSSYVGNWRWYLRYMGELFQKQVKFIS
jgi:hypothetical protein